MRRCLVIAVAALTLVGCVQASVPQAGTGILAAGPTQPPTAPTLGRAEIPYQFHGTISDDSTMVTLLTEPIAVYNSPNDPDPAFTQPGATIFGFNQVMALVEPPADGWAQVMLPGRPNNRTGWVKSDDLHFFVVGGRVVIDLSERTLTYTVDGEELIRTSVAIGTSRNPTPTGLFYVTDSIKVPGGGGPFGPYALALSGRSDTITEFNGGDGIIGIHGTNRPNLIGQAVSLGCIRLPNDVMTRLWELVPVGTPVEIRG